MAGSGSDAPPGMDPHSADLGLLLNTARAFMDREVTTFDEINEIVEIVAPFLGTFGANTGRENKTKEPVGAGEHSGVHINDNTDADEGILFKNFQHLPLEVRSKIWVAAAEAARPRGIYHFTFESLSTRPGPGHPDAWDKVLATIQSLPPSRTFFLSLQALFLWKIKGRRIKTFTPSAAVVKMTRAIRDLYRSCSEARAELMRCPALSSSFEFHYLKGGECNLGTIRPFLYDTDWVSVDGLNLDDDSDAFRTGLPGTRDIKRIQNFALPYDGFNMRELFSPGRPNLPGTGGCRGAARIFRWLDSLKSIGLYAPSFTIKRVRNWDKVITQDDRLFLKCLPAPTSVPVSTRSWSVKEYNKAIKKLQDLVGLMGWMEMQKTKERWPASACDFGALQFCFIIHADNKKGVDLMKFREDGSHLDGVELDDLGKIGALLKRLPRAGDNYR